LFGFLAFVGFAAFVGGGVGSAAPETTSASFCDLVSGLSGAMGAEPAAAAVSGLVAAGFVADVSSAASLLEPLDWIDGSAFGCAPADDGPLQPVSVKYGDSACLCAPPHAAARNSGKASATGRTYVSIVSRRPGIVFERRARVVSDGLAAASQRIESDAHGEGSDVSPNQRPSALGTNARARSLVTAT
jgi:hypothetical protein